MTGIQGRHEYHFQLQPFAPIGDFRRFTFGGSLYRLPGVLSIEYWLVGDLQNIVWPVPRPVITRRHELWRQTCFELFFGIPGEAAYWEVNIGPDGCWNLYRFTGYRQGMHEDDSVDELTCTTIRKGNGFFLSCRIDMHKLVPDCQGLQAGIAGVIQDKTGSPAYYAIDHLAKVPDFHNRRSFLMMLPGVAQR